MPSFSPAYIKTHRSGQLREKANAAEQLLERCTLCPHACGANRRAGELGICNTGSAARVSSHFSHTGEERVLTGSRGSGTIFFSYCNLQCTFCQNYLLSREGSGEEVTADAIARMMLRLQGLGCPNINFVTPSHVVPQILNALELAIPEGLHLPLVYNSSGYEAVSTLQLLDRVVDIYMPDFKFWDPTVAARVTNAPDYPQIARLAIKEMHRQVGDLVLAEDGTAKCGLLVRHLVLPDGAAGTTEIMQFLAREISPNTFVNIMDQYWPVEVVRSKPGFHRRITSAELATAFGQAKEAGIWRFAE